MGRTGARRLTVVALLAGLVLGVLPTQGFANHRQRYDELQQKIAQQRAKIREAEARERGIMGALAQSDRRRMTLERDLAILNDRLTAHGRRLALLNARLDRLQAQLIIWTAELESALGRLDDQTRLLNDRAANIYMTAPASYGTVILGQRDFHDVVAAYQYQQTVLRTDVRILDGIRDAKRRVEERRAVVVEKKAEMAKIADVIEAEANRVGGVKRLQASRHSAVMREVNYRKVLLDQVRDEKEAYLKALRSYIEESRSIEAFLLGAQKGQDVIQGRGGYLRWPISGRITSPYGWRTHPIYHKRSFHTGIDIGAPARTTVRAARGGEVLYTGYKGAYGLVVIVDHGHSVATMYAHLSRVYVRPGEHLRRLESVGAVGCTGWCTGPHLHFEVRVQGAPQNPMRWL
jgi:murein DD-endopeptidase MepM/ murein hydrolase activator NlpD